MLSDARHCGDVHEIVIELGLSRYSSTNKAGNLLTPGIVNAKKGLVVFILVYL